MPSVDGSASVSRREEMALPGATQRGAAGLRRRPRKLGITFASETSGAAAAAQEAEQSKTTKQC